MILLLLLKLRDVWEVKVVEFVWIINWVDVGGGGRNLEEGGGRIGFGMDVGGRVVGNDGFVLLCCVIDVWMIDCIIN